MGCGVGDGEGAFVGDALVGKGDGSAVVGGVVGLDGATDGLAVGSTVGDGDGLDVGDAVVGEIVGPEDAVGDRVGEVDGE